MALLPQSIDSWTQLNNTDKRDRPFFEPNYDIFWLSKKFQEISQNEKIRNILKEMVDLNKKASLNYWRNQEKTLSSYDICLQAFLLSYLEDFREQVNVTQLCWGIWNIDITNLKKVFKNYWDNNKRSFKKSILFSINFIALLYKKYQNISWSWTNRFDDFLFFQESIESSGETNEISFPYNWENTRIIFNFRNWTTEIHIPNIYMWYYWENNKLLSELFDENNPFETNEKLNFIFPLWYRGFVFPLINVTKITIVSQKDNREYSKQEYNKLNDYRLKTGRFYFSAISRLKFW